MPARFSVPNSATIRMKEELEYKINNENPTPRKKFIRETFDSIAETYDVLNRVLSCGVDMSWRKFAVNLLKDARQKLVVDLCSGTGDFVALLREKGATVVAVDFSIEMLKKGRQLKRIEEGAIAADVCRLPFRDMQFDAAFIAFGVRNIPDINVFIDEVFRVLKENAELVVLELTRPSNGIVRALYRFYLAIGVPIVGGIVSGKLRAYRYLSKTIQSFIEPEHFARMLERGGFANIAIYRRFFGIATIIHCTRRKEMRMSLQ
ncbi:MAG: ubiquinone/menaquinone biosynthesis methyltransferase [Spirochaetes bacterium]|nr:ubiquinone/menaquinone biosynthesis methyltransferase [Spirochaetota bacterium]